mmetsp:Transcript_47671/g.87632  ORF Transcript_47671/g.87632 Transcript_47671/m.87632 type:complete len:182 (+) Transcript_47671:104-649(+)
MSTHRALMTALLVSALLPDMVAANSMHMAKMCREQYCEDPAFPLIDYTDGSCVCRRHPCWNHEGFKHECTGDDFPFLHMVYEEDGTLSCKCSSVARYDSPYIIRDLCPGKQCADPEYPILDVDEDGTSCLCRSHPCWNAKGQKHECNKADFPILRYREDKAGDPVCECVAKLHEPAPKEEL